MHLAVIISALLFSFVSFSAEAMVVQTKTLKAKASFIRNKQLRMYDFLDLKSKSIRFTQADIKACQTQLKRASKTLNFSCTLNIPTRSKVSKLSRRNSPAKVALRLGDREKLVNVDISKDARKVTFSTVFESVGIDYDMAEFNADFHEVMNQAALQIFSKAMKSKLAIQVLEN